jgi:integrase
MSLTETSPATSSGKNLWRHFVSRHHPQTVFAGLTSVFKSVDRGLTWMPISRNLGAAVTVLAESARTSGLLYAGMKNGSVHVTPDGGRNWSNVTAKFGRRRFSRSSSSKYADRTSNEWVFATARGARDGHIRGKLKKICRRANIKATTVHALRHSFGAHLRMAGVSLADIADLLGHKDLATTQIYAKVQQQHLRSVVGKLTGLLPAAAEKSDASLKMGTEPSPIGIY